jgi:hypothetical protein
MEIQIQIPGFSLLVVGLTSFFFADHHRPVQ